MNDVLEHWWMFPEAWEHPVGSAMSSSQEQKAEDSAALIEKLKKALRFYRDATSYELDMDCGERARKALGEKD